MTHIHRKGLIEQNRYTSVPGSPQKLYRGRWALRERRIEAPWQHTEKCVQCLCKSCLWKTGLCTQLIQLPEKAAGSTLLYKAFIRAVARVQWGKGALLGSSALHTVNTSLMPKGVTPFMLSFCLCVFYAFVPQLLKKAVHPWKGCAEEGNTQHWGRLVCTHVLSATTCPLELGCTALTANWRNEIPTPCLQVNGQLTQTCFPESDFKPLLCLIQSMVLDIKLEQMLLPVLRARPICILWVISKQHSTTSRKQEPS